MSQAATGYVTFEDYFESEVASDRDPNAPRCEWFDGVVYSMSRGSPEHARLAFRTGRALANALPATCEVYSSDLMLFIEAASLSTCADATVVCGALETTTVRKNGKSLGAAVTNPRVLIEILSESTERYDRDGKFQAYKRIDSLDEYVLVSQHVRKVEVFRRSTGFRGDVAVGGESFVVHGVSIAVDDIYGGPTG